jgi:alpha-ketoglutarate-dependent taurine dioxygenase
MKTRALKNYSSSVGCEVYDIDLNSDEEILELGRLVAEQCVVFVDQKISTERLYHVMTAWGQTSRALIHNYIADEKLTGRHWREIYLNLGLVGKKYSTVNKEMARAVSSVSYRKDQRNRPTGLFSNGELDWHSDQCATDDAPRTIGLQSISDTARSQTQFLCTHDAYESLSSDMKSMVKELVCKHRWVDGAMAPALNPVQSLVIRYNMVPLDGMETKLYTESATGLSGIKLPSHSFDGFVGMSVQESQRVFDELRSAIFKEQYVYTQNWDDGQIVFMDQEITLHKRPTNVKDGDLRTMARVITYLDKLYPHCAPYDFVRYQGQQLSHDQFAALVDADRLRVFESEQDGDYVTTPEYEPIGQ